MQFRVYYEDTDSGGIVYHTNYIKYCERARSELFFSNGMMPTLGTGSGFVVHNINAKFLSSAKLGDMLNVTTKVLKKKNTSIILLQEIYKNEQKVFSMEVTLAFIENEKVSKIPQKFQDIFLNM